MRKLPFCVGKQIDSNPEIYQKVKSSGHSVANHSFTHLNGWSSENITYFHDVRQGATRAKSELFRPPFGHLKVKQAQFLQRHYQIVMWDVMSGDFDESIDADQVTSNVINHATGGSIIVFHDTLKAFPDWKKPFPLFYLISIIWVIDLKSWRRKNLKLPRVKQCTHNRIILQYALKAVRNFPAAFLNLIKYEYSKKIRALWRPEMYHGWGKSTSYFEGWYLKMIDSTRSHAYAIIPGLV